MKGLFDVVLGLPLPEGPWKALLVFFFMLHLTFVLFTLGTVILGTVYLARERLAGEDAVAGWDRHFFRTFFAHKSLALVLGVGPILLMQVGNSVPFLTGVHMMAPAWLLLVLLLLAALVAFEVLAARGEARGWHVAVAVVGAAALLAVPGIFAAVVVATENPDRWVEMLDAGGQLPPALALHWALRTLHVLGAAVTVTAALHLALFARGKAELRRAMAGWTAGGVAFQVVAGVALLGSLPSRAGMLVTAVVTVGATAAALLAWTAWRSRAERTPAAAGVLVLGLLVLTPMVLARQLLQDRVLVPLGHALETSAREHAAETAPFRAAALDGFQAGREVAVAQPATVFLRSCAFCHGVVGNGAGDDAGPLAVPPEDLTRLRMGDAALRRVLLEGVPGTAMPRFGFYTGGELERLRLFLRGTVGLGEAPDGNGAAVGQAARARAEGVFHATCAACHGKDGRGTALSATFSPAPPDLAAMTPTAGRALEVITNGYPGTMMPAFGALPEETRRGLVDVVHGLYR